MDQASSLPSFDVPGPAATWTGGGTAAFNHSEGSRVVVATRGLATPRPLGQAERGPLPALAALGRARSARGVHGLPRRLGERGWGATAQLRREEVAGGA